MEYVAGSAGVQTATVKPQLSIFNQAPWDPACPHHVLPAGVLFITMIDGHLVGEGDMARLLKGSHTVDGTNGDPPGQDDPCAGQVFEAAPVSNVGASGSSATVTAAWRVGVNAGSSGASILRASGIGWAGPGGPGQPAVWSFYRDQVTGIADLFTSSSSGGVFGKNGFQGPVGIAVATTDAAQNGWITYLTWMGEISLIIAFMNVLPIPMLDGGKIWFIVLEAIRGKRLDPKREMKIYAGSAAFIAIFVLMVTIANIRNLINPH